MQKIDVTDEAVIDSPPLVVFKAILNETAGVTHWWMPHLESRLRGETPIDREGSIFDVTIHSRETPRWTAKITKIVEGKLIELEEEGDIVGTGRWTFEPTDGKTKIRFRWNVRLKRLLFVLVSPFINIGQLHSEVMQKGFKALNSYLSQK
jgi:hypothetical protein